jgi:hypothetical protein
MSYETDLDYKMALDERLTALNADASCRCPQQAHIWFENCPRWEGCHEHHSPPPDRCESCGGEVVAFQIIYVDDWRAGLKDELWR